MSTEGDLDVLIKRAHCLPPKVSLCLVLSSIGVEHPRCRRRGVGLPGEGEAVVVGRCSDGISGRGGGEVVAPLPCTVVRDLGKSIDVSCTVEKSRTEKRNNQGEKIVWKNRENMKEDDKKVKKGKLKHLFCV